MPGQITWIGHATVLIELDGVRLLTDPLLRNRLGHLRRHGPRPDPEALRDVDAVLISHLHFDHLDLPSLRRLRQDIRLLVPRGAGGFLHRQGFPHAEELAVGGVAEVGGVAVTAVDALHDGRRRPYAGGPSADAIGFVVDGRVYFAGDTDLFDAMAELRGTDVALIPVWGWGPSLGDGHLDPPSAARATALVRPRVAVPIHWGTFFPRGLARFRGDRLTDPPHEYAAAVAQLAPDVDVRVLTPGQTLALPGQRATRPRALLLDEVTSALDPELVGEVPEVVRELKAEGVTMLIATHEIGFAREVADQVCFLHDGLIVEHGDPEQIFTAPEQPETQRFLRRLLEAGRL